MAHSVASTHGVPAGLPSQRRVQGSELMDEVLAGAQWFVFDHAVKASLRGQPHTAGRGDGGRSSVQMFHGHRMETDAQLLRQQQGLSVAHTKTAVGR